ncbi:3'(2'),5'-bisphosphate nucleotidase CysQ [Zhengella mangrovi]|uniref:3'(2'),5'-bisphosphate nucleotidase CysQ n=1 Tax=Zhengella mangrovi TaxID=1982044 RepID=A0A2G1QL62_9HYPH|nr:3'(2'),5'-bisphosphate nucleotidase CysQ [Zhengella mangrovi]PHP66209.1 3'(2'),5'-bisphosphate nucleotidase CysQ [Zhengella mangrovi]
MPANDAALVGLDGELALLREAAREAGRIALRYFRRDPDVWMKDGNSPVSEADLAVDSFLRDGLMAARPDYGWLSEETADDLARLEARRTFVVDPIDGTRAFVDGRDVWCVSVAIVEDGRSIAGVLDCPVLDEVYEASAGGGARRNGEPLAVNGTRDEPVLGGPAWMTRQLPAALRDRMHRIAHIPSLAYRLAMVADGRLDGTFIRPDSHDWDIAAAELVLREAGGSLVGSDGDTPPMATRNSRHGRMAAGSPAMLPQLLSTLRTMT